MNRLPASALVIALAASAIVHEAEPKLPAGYSCADVRAKVAEIGRMRALALAIEHGASWAEIREARKCLK